MKKCLHDIAILASGMATIALLLQYLSQRYGLDPSHWTSIHALVIVTGAVMFYALREGMETERFAFLGILLTLIFTIFFVRDGWVALSVMAENSAVCLLAIWAYFERVTPSDSRFLVVLFLGVTGISGLSGERIMMLTFCVAVLLVFALLHFVRVIPESEIHD